MNDEIENDLDFLSGDLKAQAQSLIASLKNDQEQAQKAREEARVATLSINKKLHLLAEAKWKMLPIAVQREHDTLVTVPNTH